MNVERMNRLADKLDGIEDVPIEKCLAGGKVDDLEMNGFQMNWTRRAWRSNGRPRGLCGCVAGWACELFDKPPPGTEDAGLHNHLAHAREALELDDEQAMWLFEPHACIPVALDKIRASEAAAAVRAAAEGAPETSWWADVEVDAQ